MKIDVVIVSYAKNTICKEYTVGCIKSLLLSEDNSENLFNIIVVESNHSVTYDNIASNVKTYKAPLPYGYHKFLNFGRKQGNAEWIALCNNDLIFQPNWFTKILEAHEIDPSCESFSPMCSISQNYDKKIKLLYGYHIRRNICGWCLVHKRSIYEKIGDLDENFIHWCCDSDFSMSLFKNDIKHALVTDSIVDHHLDKIGITTKLTVSTQEEINNFTSGAKLIFDTKYPVAKNYFNLYRNEIINKLIEKNNYKTYLEIGVANGQHFSSINCQNKLSVDPYSDKAIVKITSDDFFAKIDKTTKYDIIFIDGSHIDTQVDRDIENSLKHLGLNGTIVIHDTNPPSEFYAKNTPYYPPPIHAYWNGTVYKSIIKLRCTREDLSLYTVDTDWGVTILQIGSSELIKNSEYSFDYFEKNKKEILNLISVEEFLKNYN